MANKLLLNLDRAWRILVAVLLATGLDYAAHGLSQEFAVPGYYFHNKVLYGFLWSLVGLLLFRRIRGDAARAAAVAGFVAVILQLRYYFLEGYALWFVVIFLFPHFLMFWLSFALMLRLSRGRF